MIYYMKQSQITYLRPFFLSTAAFVVVFVDALFKLPHDRPFGAVLIVIKVLIYAQRSFVYGRNVYLYVLIIWREEIIYILHQDIYTVDRVI